MLLQPSCQATAGPSLLKALRASRKPQRSSFATIIVLAKPSARPKRALLLSAASDVVNNRSVDDDEDDDWDSRQEFGEPELLGGEEAFGPPAVVLAGFFLEELAAVRLLLDEAGGEGISVIPSTPALLRTPVGAAILTPEPHWDEPLPPDWVPGGGWGMQRTVLLSGLGLEAQAAVLELMATSKIGSVVPAVATPDNAGRLLGEVLAEAFKAYRTAPEGRSLGGGQQFVDELPSVKDIAAAAAGRTSQPRQPEQPAAPAAPAPPAAAGERQEQAAAQQAPPQEPRSPASEVTEVEAELAGSEGGGSSFGAEGEEGDYPWGSGGPEGAANPRSLDDLLEELGGGWQLVDVQEEMAAEGSEDAEWEEWQNAERQGAPAASPQQAAAAERGSASASDGSGSGSGSASASGFSSQGHQQQKAQQEEVVEVVGASSSSSSRSSSSREGMGPAASAAAGPVEADLVVAPSEGPQQQEGGQQGGSQQGAAASGSTAAEQDEIDDPRWARFASEILDAESWVVPDLGTPQQAQQEQPSPAGDFVRSGRARRGAVGAAGRSAAPRSAAVEGRAAAAGTGEVASDEDLLDVIDRLAAGEPLAKSPLPGSMPGRAPGFAPTAGLVQQQQPRQQQQQQQAQQQPGGAVSPGQLFAARSRQQQQERQQAVRSSPAQQASAQPRGFGNKAGAQPSARLAARRVPASMRSIAASRLAAPTGNTAASGASADSVPQVARAAAQRSSPGSAAARAQQRPAGQQVVWPTPTASQAQPRPAATAAIAGGRDTGPGEAASAAANPGRSEGGSSPDAGSEGQAAGGSSNASSTEAGSSSVIGAGSGRGTDVAGAGSSSSGTGGSSSVDDSDDEEMVREYTREMTKGISTNSTKGAAPGVTTMTKAELRAVAEKHGLSFEQLLADAQARGIELPD